MISRLKPKSKFGRHVLTLMVGTGISQAIPIAISPILTRIYTPNDFGVFSLYIAIVTIVSVVATGRYELAMMLPRKDSYAVNLLVLSVCISGIVSMALLSLVYLFNEEITKLLGNPEISNVLYFVPFSVLATAAYQNFRYYNNRLKQYSSISKSRVSQSAVAGAANIGTGFMAMGAIGLASGSLLGNMVGIANLFRSAKIPFHVIDARKIIALSKRYSSYPLVDIPSSLFNDLSQQAPNLLFLPLFGAAFSGYYFLVQRMFMMPIKLISTTIAEVFRQEASSQYNKTGSFENIFIVTFKKLFFVSLAPFLLLMIFGRELFVFVFGNDWEIAGIYTQILAPMFMLKFVVSPLTYAIYIRNKLKFNMVGQLLFLISILVSIAIGYHGRNATLSVIAISVSQSVVYLSYLAYSYYLAVPLHRQAT